MHAELQTLLKQRIDIIADHSSRDHDPSAHLAALKEVSEKIIAYSQAHESEFDAKLRHYLSNFSYPDDPAGSMPLGKLYFSAIRPSEASPATSDRELKR